MPVTGPDFISLQATDLDASREFYERYLGLVRSQAGPPHAVVFETTPIAFALRDLVPRYRTLLCSPARHRCRDLAPRHGRPSHPRCPGCRGSHHRLGAHRRPFRPHVHLCGPRRLPRHIARPRLSQPPRHVRCSAEWIARRASWATCARTLQPQRFWASGIAGSLDVSPPSGLFDGLLAPLIPHAPLGVHRHGFSTRESEVGPQGRVPPYNHPW